MRDIYWDVVKGLGVLLVLIGHVGGKLVPYIYMYHVALFFFVAGYFFKVDYAADPFSYMGSRLKRLWWPCAQYGAGFVLLHNLFCKLGFYSVQAGIHPYTLEGFAQALFGAFTLQSLEQEPLVATLWFIEMMLPDLFIFCGICFLARMMPKQFQRQGMIFLLTVLFYGAGVWMTLYPIYLPWHFHITCILLIVVYMGYVYRKLERYTRLHWLAAFLAAGVLFAIYQHTGTWVELSLSRILGWKWFLLANVVGIYFHLWLCHIVSYLPRLQMILAYIGRHSLHVIALQFLALRLVSIVRIYVEKMPMDALAMHPLPGYPIPESGWWLVYIVFGLLIPLVILWLWQHVVVLLRKMVSSWAYTEKR